MLRKLNPSAKSDWMMVIFIQLLAAALLTACAFLHLNSVLDLQTETAVSLLSVMLLALSIWFLWSWWIITRSLFNLYVMFIIAAVLFNGGQAFLEIFHLNEFGILDGRFSPEMILGTLFLVALGLIAFHIGGLLSVLPFRRNPLSNNFRIEGTNTGRTLRALRLTGWILLAVSLIPAFWILKNEVALTLVSGRSASFQQPLSTGGVSSALYKLADFIVPGVLFLLAGSKGIRFNVRFSHIIVLSYCGGSFLAGSRQGASMLLIAYAWTYHRCVRPLSKMFLLGAGSLLLLIVFPLIQATREFGIGEGRFQILRVLQDTFTRFDNPIVLSLSEIGNSMRIVAYSLSYVPDYRDFDMGTSYLYALFSLVPNLFWEVHPAFAYGALDRWLVQLVDPFLLLYYPEAALGFSFIAEAYVNFGWFGAPCALGIMGFLLGKFVLWVDRSADPARIAMVGAFTAFFLLFARGESYEILRGLIWYSLLPYIGACVLGSFLETGFHKPGDYSRGSEVPALSRLSEEIEKL